MSTLDQLPSLAPAESSSPPPTPVKKLSEHLTEDESRSICDCLSAPETAAETDPVIVMDYRGNALTALRNHYAAVAVLPAFLLGVVPATEDALASAITTAVVNGRGVVVSPRLISGHQLAMRSTYLVQRLSCFA